MKIALLGASGNIGQRIILEALVRGHEVKALVRDPQKLLIVHPRLTVATVNIIDTASISNAISDVDVVVNATGPGHSGDPQKFFKQSVNALVEAMRHTDGKRLLVVGGAGSLEVAPGLKLVDTPDFHPAWKGTALGHDYALSVYRSSDINWTFFSPSALIIPGRRTGKYRTGNDQLLSNDQGESYISMEDFAVALLDEIEHPRFLSQRFTAVSLEK